MNTPICDFIQRYTESNSIRLHMPGHKGYGEAEARDITEIDGADVLYHGNGIIRESEKNAASLFGAGRTVYSAEGSSLSIRASLYLASIYQRERGIPPLIAAGRNAHKAFLSAAALLGFDIKWLCSEGEGVTSCTLSPAKIEAEFSSGDLPSALYVTSPDYLGNISDISGISRVCKKYGVLLIVDNAHGAYLRFLPESAHPISLGADICCDSAHKTLPVLTGGGYLHISEKAPKIIYENCDAAMSLFASTSPSYLILDSLDRVNPYLEGRYREELAALCQQVKELKARLASSGFSLVGDEPAKITIATKSYGYTGEAITKHLADHKIIAEFYDRDYLTMMFTPKISACDMERVKSALLALPKKPPIDERPPIIPPPKIATSVREAVMSPSETVTLSNAVGRILASVSISCPPAIPIAVSGEVITADTVEALRYYGISEVRVVK